MRDMIKKGLNNPDLAPIYLYKRILEKILPGLYSNDVNALKFIRLISLRVNSTVQRRTAAISQTNVMMEDWDNLILLDGCRMDLYSQIVSVRENTSECLDSRFSIGSASPEFLSKTFDGSTYHDTVYISANPFARTIPNNTFHASHALIGNNNYWSEDVKTIPPDRMTAAALKLAKKYPNKRLIIHYMQPHHPFLGPSAEKVPFNRGVYGHNRDMQFTKDPWDEAYNSIRNDHHLLRRAYNENLKLVLDCVDELIPKLSGKTIISADHANLIGDRGFPIPTRGYGHPMNIFSKPLLEVPWHIFSYNNRKRIQTDPPVMAGNANSDDLTDRLTHLGYK